MNGLAVVDARSDMNVARFFVLSSPPVWAFTT
jgi:hypothetical protein